MRTSTFILAASAALVAAQDIKPYIPTCADDCLKKAATSSSTCTVEPLDGKCICEDATFQKIFGASVNCVLSACGQEVALNQVLPGTKKYCADVAAGKAGGKSSSSAAPPPASSSSSAAPPPASSSSSAATTPGTTTAASSSAASSAAPSTTMSSYSASGTSMPSSSSSSMAPGGGSNSTSSGSKPTATATSTPVSAGAASVSAGFFGLVAAVGLGVFGLL